MKILDTHHHLWDLRLRDYEWMNNVNPILKRNYLIEDLNKITSKNNISNSICIQAHHSLGETEWLLNIAEKSDIILGVVGWVDLSSNRLEETLDKLQKNKKFIGVRHIWHDELNEDWIIENKIINGIRSLAQRGLKFDFLVRPNHLRYISDLYEKISDLNGVIDHIAKPNIKDNLKDEWAEEISKLSKIPSLYCKISGIVTEMSANQDYSHVKPFTSEIISSFGLEKIMFGSDWPVCLSACSYKEVIKLANDITDEFSLAEKQKIFFENGIKFYLN